jgi:hypothetical protein
MNHFMNAFFQQFIISTAHSFTNSSFYQFILSLTHYFINLMLYKIIFINLLFHLTHRKRLIEKNVSMFLNCVQIFLSAKRTILLLTRQCVAWCIANLWGIYPWS